MTKNAIFIAATGQNVGKTTLCLGIISGLQKRFKNVGFIKPVGQQHITFDDGTTADKDVVLFKEQFDLSSAYTDMSPVIIPPGFTRQYLDGKISDNLLKNKICSAFQKISKEHDYTIVEGTGHVGVGSIINMSNAKVAAELNLNVVIIASGGLGSAYDELALNIAMCRLYDVKVQGVILNRVLDHKREMILDYFPRTLKQWNIPLIGCIPYNEFLSTPAIKDFEILFETSLLSGKTHRYRHFRHPRLVAGSLEAYQKEIVPNELVITPASRQDIITAILQKHAECACDGKNFGAGVILTGRHPPNEDILQQIQRADIPALYAPVCSYDAMKMITSFTAKINRGDTSKVQQAIKLVEENMNFDLLCQTTAQAQVK